jgi:regulator of replication initiation timing
MLVIEQYNHQVDEFNAVVEQCEALDDRNTTLGLQVAGYAEKLADMELTTKEARAAEEIAKAQIAVLQGDKRQLKTENDQLKSMNPERQKTQIVSLKEAIANKTTLLDQQKQEMRKIRGELATTKTNLAVAIQQNAELSLENEELRTRLQRIDGDVEPVWYPAADNSGLQFYFYTFGWRLTLGSTDRDLHLDLLQDIDWHIEIRSNSGISVLVSVTQWCRARYPILDQFKSAWPSALGIALNRRIIELLGDTHPHLVQRTEWAMATPLSNLPLQDKWLDLLNASGLYSLWTVVSHTPEELSNLVKGFGIATARQVHAACMKVVKDWQAENWPKPNVA